MKYVSVTGKKDFNKAQDFSSNFGFSPQRLSSSSRVVTGE
jgi:hypothetical protein